MNDRQRLTWIAGLCVITLMALFPPWSTHSVRTEAQASPNMRNSREVLRVEPTVRYALFLAPPSAEASIPVDGSSKTETVTLAATILWDRLVLQWVIVAALCAALGLAFGVERPAAGGEDDEASEAEEEEPVNLGAVLAFVSPENLQEARRKAGLSQTDLAGKLGVRMRDVNHWERGKKRVPRRLAVAIHDLLGGGGRG